MTDTQSGCTTTETTVRNQSTFFSKMTGFNIRGRIQHFLHTWATFGTFIRNDHYITTHHLASEDTLTSCLLRIKHFSRSRKLPDTCIHACCFHDTAILSYISFQYCQTTIFTISMFQVTDTPFGTICIKLFIKCMLRPKYKIKFTGCST